MNSKFKAQLLLTLVPAILLLFLVGWISYQFNVQIQIMTRDITAIANIHPFSGFLSTFGIFLWCGVVFVCFFTAVILYRIGEKKHLRFLLSSAILSLYLLLDDMFLFHERLAPNHLSIDENVIFVLLGLTVFAYLIIFHKTIMQTRYQFLLLALFLLSSSVLIDAILEPWLKSLGQWEFFIEDGAKWLGIVSWGSYYYQTTFQLLLGVFKSTVKPNLIN